MKGKKSSSAPRRASAHVGADLLLANAPLGETAALLALAAPAAGAPSPRVKEQLLARIRAVPAPVLVPPPVAAPGWRFESAGAAAGWRSALFPGVRFKTLSVDEARDVVMVLLEMAPGARFPDHPHDAGADEGVVLSGDVVTGGRLLRAGDYYHAAAGTVHNDTVSPSGCTAVVSLTATAWKKWRQFTVA